MRPYLLVSLLLLSLLVSEAKGIRLDKKFMSHGQQTVHEDGSGLMKETNGGVGDQVILCKDGHCSGKNRKLITTTTSTSITTTTSKNEKNEENKADPMSKGKSGNGEHGEKDNFLVNGKPTSEHREIAHEHFPDIVELAEMDYSPQKRTPPIHN